MQYSTIRHIHMVCAAITIVLFALRWVLDLTNRGWRQWRWLRVAPHVNDSLLLTAAVALATLSHQYPWQLPWLGAKVTLLLVYIGLGTMALRTGLSTKTRLAWGLCALCAVFSIVAFATFRPFFLPPLTT
jgi:uncharacterized membrane protein SirB2